MKTKVKNLQIIEKLTSLNEAQCLLVLVVDRWVSTTQKGVLEGYKYRRPVGWDGVI